MRRVIVALLLLLEPLHFGFEAVRVLSTIAYRGLVPALELGVHAIIAVVCAGVALAFWNGAPDAMRLLLTAVLLAVARTVQSVYWSSLPDDTRPGDEVYVAVTAVAVGALAIALGRRRQAG